jgi:ubiquinone/menaquinone biosynthesis C-methylase UbiE
MSIIETIEHYDKLIDEDNDPFYDPKPLSDYMEKRDGQKFIDAMLLNKSKSVLEIGIGTGRIANKVAPLCKSLLGIDISPKTIQRASENLSAHKNTKLI